MKEDSNGNLSFSFLDPISLRLCVSETGYLSSLSQLSTQLTACNFNRILKLIQFSLS